MLGLLSMIVSVKYRLKKEVYLLYNMTLFLQYAVLSNVNVNCAVQDFC